MTVILSEALRAAATQTPDRVLIVDGADTLDCRALEQRANGLAQVLLARLPVGSVVSFMLPNWHEAAIVYLGATLAGMVVNPILPSLREHELSYILADCESRTIFIPSTFRGHDYPAMLTSVCAGLPNPPEVIVVRGDQPWVTSPVHTDLPQLDLDDIRMVLYTSGTTGKPKGVLHSHRSLGALIAQLHQHWRIEPGATFLVPSPVAHIGGSIYAFECPLLLDTTAVLMDRWDAAAAVALMTEHRCTHMAGATPFLTGLLAAAEKAHTRLPDLKVFICGGASVSPQLIRSATAYFDKATITRVYGSTEIPVTTVGAPDHRDRAADTDGRPGIADVKLVDGEIRAKGPQMLLGYLHPEDDALDADGYFRTGDLGRWTDDGYLVVTGRAKDLIIRNGENISPKEIEDILAGHPDIDEVAVVGLPDERTGERTVAVLITAATITVADLRRYLTERGVARFKMPEQVEIWDALPKNDAGKILKQQIRTELAACQ
ncbi:MAG: AMP-binding protein [Mycobacterium sp.]